MQNPSKLKPPIAWLELPRDGREFTLLHTRRLINSLTNHDPSAIHGMETMNDGQMAQRVFNNPAYAMVSHGVEADPILNYGNSRALNLWQMDWEDFVKTPSRQTAEADQQVDRNQLLERLEEEGFVDDYSGIRIAANGTRFRIENALLWKVLDENQERIGTAAMFKDWEKL